MPQHPGDNMPQPLSRIRADLPRTYSHAQVSSMTETNMNIQPCPIAAPTPTPSLSPTSTGKSPLCTCRPESCPMIWPDSCHCQNEGMKKCYETCGGPEPVYQVGITHPLPSYPIYGYRSHYETSVTLIPDIILTTTVLSPTHLSPDPARSSLCPHLLIQPLHPTLHNPETACLDFASNRLILFTLLYQLIPFFADKPHLRRRPRQLQTLRSLRIHVHQGPLQARVRTRV